jgi:putative adhesin
MRSETFATPGAVRLNLEIPSGVIEVESSKTAETHVALEALSNDDAVRDLVEKSRVELLRRGDGYEVVVEVPMRSGLWISFSRGPDIRFGGPDIRLRITCPSGAELDVRTKSANLEARGGFGPVEVKTASGDVNVQEVAGDARVKTASGDIRFEKVDGRLDVNSAAGDLHVGAVTRETQIQLVSGDVFIGEAGASVGANTVSGDHRIEAVLQGRVDLRAISGDISVGIPRGTRLFVDANTVSGSTSSEVELDDAPAQESAAPGAPLVEVFAKTVSGDIRIERASARPRATAELSEQS